MKKVLITGATGATGGNAAHGELMNLSSSNVSKVLERRKKVLYLA
jgi:hypothetical protein